MKTRVSLLGRLLPRRRQNRHRSAFPSRYAGGHFLTEEFLADAFASITCRRCGAMKAYVGSPGSTGAAAVDWACTSCGDFVARNTTARHSVLARTHA